VPIFGNDTTHSNPSRAGMKHKINQTLLDQLETLSAACPNGAYTNACPFRLLNMLSRPARLSLLNDMKLDQVYGLFDLAKGCSCPKDPRRTKTLESNAE
jgi:hypothetical protein